MAEAGTPDNPAETGGIGLQPLSTGYGYLVVPATAFDR
jgi:hypothetical protein